MMGHLGLCVVLCVYGEGGMTNPLYYLTSFTGFQIVNM